MRKNKAHCGRGEVFPDGWEIVPTPRESRLRRRAIRTSIAENWKLMLAGVTIHAWRHPVNQDCRVAYLIGRVPRERLCRYRPTVPLVITFEEECACRSAEELESVLVSKLERAVATYVRMVLPHRVRRSSGERCRQQMLEQATSALTPPARSWRHWGPPMQLFPPPSASGR